MKVFWVMAWDKYYPTADNFIAFFETEEEAEEFVEKKKAEDFTYDFFEVVNITDRLY